MYGADELPMILLYPLFSNQTNIMWSGFVGPLIEDRDALRLNLLFRGPGCTSSFLQLTAKKMTRIVRMFFMVNGVLISDVGVTMY